MLQGLARSFGALMLGAALAWSLNAAAQSPAPPKTEPTKDAKVTNPPAAPVEAPKAASPPVPAQGSTAVPGWNNPPVDWGSVSTRPQYASIPGRETNVLINAGGREWRAFRNG